MKDLIGKNVLITTSQWFFAPDGLSYKAVFGVLNAINTSEDTLGFTPSRTHTNWFIKVGNMTIAGCQIQYLVESDRCVLTSVIDYTSDRTEKNINSPSGFDAEMYRRPSTIYHAK